MKSMSREKNSRSSREHGLERLADVGGRDFAEPFGGLEDDASPQLGQVHFLEPAAVFEVDGHVVHEALERLGWWKTTNGKVTFKETGIFQNENGKWYVRNSQVDFTKFGRVKYDGKTYTVMGGKVVA